MALLQIEGDISGVSEKQILFIQDVIQKQGFKYKVVFETIKKTGNNNDNFQRITVENENGEEVKLIAKIASADDALRECFFRNEIAMYKQVLLKYLRTQTAARLPEEEIYKFPKCYGCFAEEMNEVILIEDLEAATFIFTNKFTPMCNEAIKIIIRKLARLHSMSFVVRRNEPGVYDILKSKLVDILRTANETQKYKEFLAQVENNVTEVLNDNKNIRKIQDVMKQMPEQLSQIKKYEATIKHLVILHGNICTENVMLKYEEDKPSDCIMIDYQMSKEGNPAEDIWLMALNCTGHATRVQHFEEWIDYYHEQLDLALSDFGMKANFVYPRNQLDADLKRYSKICFVISVANYYKIAKESETVDSVNEGNMLSGNAAEIFKFKVEDLVDSYRNLGYMP